MKFRQKFLRYLENCSQREFIFRGLYMVEYLSDLDEKWMVREVNIGSF